MTKQEHFNEVWKKEGIGTWRRYPGTFNRISWFVGSGKKVLDVGCGVGYLLYMLKKNGNDCWGIDVSDEAITLLVEKLGMTGLSAEVPPIYLEDNQFDVVIATEFFEHIEKEQELLAECKRVCKQGGWIIIAVPNNELPPSEEPEHVRVYTRKSFEELLGKVSNEFYIEEFLEQFTTKETLDSLGQTKQLKYIKIPVLLGRVKVNE